MKGREMKKETKKEKADKANTKVQSEYQREKASRHDKGLDIKNKL